MYDTSSHQYQHQYQYQYLSLALTFRPPNQEQLTKRPLFPGPYTLSILGEGHSRRKESCRGDENNDVSQTSYEAAHA